MKGKIVRVVLLAAAVAWGAAPDELAVARRALGDGLWSVAAKHAVAAAGTTTNAEVRSVARQVELEALAGAGQPAEMLRRLEAWPEATGEAFRYWRAWAKASAGDGAGARKVLAASFAEPTYRVLALRLSARLAVEAGDRDAAQDHFAKAAAALASDPARRVENAVEWAQARARFEDVEGALEILRREGALEAASPTGDEARLLAATLARQKGDAATERRLLEGLIKGGSNTSERAYVLANCARAEAALAAGTLDEAVQSASNAVARATAAELVRRAGFTLGFALLAQPGSRGAARTLVAGLVRRYPGEVESRQAQLRLADGLLAAGDAAAALQEYDALLQSYPEHMLDAHVLEGRGLSLARSGRHAEAVGVLARAAQVATNGVLKAHCLFDQAEALLADGRHAEAAVVYGSVGEGPLRAEAVFRQAEALVGAGAREEALKLFRGIAAAGGLFAVEAGLRTASLEAAGGRVEKAVADFGRVLDAKANPKTTPAQRARAFAGRGRALYRAYRFREAEADFAAVAKLEPARAAEMGFLSALCLYGDGRDREARTLAASLVASTPESPLRFDLRFWIAKCDAAARDWPAAIAGFEACATNVSASGTRRVEALVRAVRCAAALPDSQKVVQLVGRLMQKPEAAAARAKATPSTPLVAEALVLQGEALVELADFNAALLVFERAAHLSAPDALLHRAALARADCLFAMGADDANRYRSALDAYRAVARDDAVSASLRLAAAFKIGRTLEKLRRFEEAADQFYVNVVMAYWDAVRPDAGVDAARRVWFDGNARAFFARAAFTLADYYETRGEPRQAVQVLGYLVAARVASADEARRRIARIKEKGGL